jgi:SNF2 family DNA or RNA helicase
MSNIEQTFFIVDRRKVPVKLIWDKDRIRIQSGYNKTLIDRIKTFDGAKYHGFDEVNPTKDWSIKATERNIFQLMFLEGLNPYERYDKPLLEYESKRSLRPYQIDGIRHLITRRQCILGSEMGLGKTLMAIETMEWAAKQGLRNWLWVAPKSVLYANKLEFQKWKAEIMPTFMSYNMFEKCIGDQYDGVVFDESSRLKNPNAQRSKSAMKLASTIRNLRNNDGFVILMSGTPAPRNPTDWYWQVEVCCPGFLVEGNIHKFRDRLGLIVKQEGLAGNTFPKLVTWYDKEGLCRTCGMTKDHANHVIGSITYHSFNEAKNEVKVLGERMKGIAIIQLKKDLLNLPDKIYRLIKCDIDSATRRAMTTIAAKAPRAITALNLLRELSDGFQYIEVVTDRMGRCEVCDGVGKITEAIASTSNDGIDVTISGEMQEVTYEMVTIVCPHCKGEGKAPIVERQSQVVKSPKMAVLQDLLDEYSEIGRLVIYGGYQGSVDICTDIAKKAGWNVIQVDGRGWINTMGIKDNTEVLRAFQENFDDYPLIAFVAQPGAGGMGLTLTASPAIVYYSNDYNAESRMQSEDRIHRLGMDTNAGATIIDIIHLPTDELILQNLKKKRDLQTITTNELRRVF